ncbi:MAG TPA: helix-turn-helix domain-containing protein [Microbacteriaceae bacterium]
MADPEQPEAGFRERKRASARLAMERIALELGHAHGYENTTVEMICEVGQISQRTFFNYFGSKEGVFLGVVPAAPSDEEIARFLAGGGENLLSDLVTVITAAIIDQELDIELMTSRRELIMATPELSKALMARMSDAEDQFVALVLRRFAAEGRVGSEAELDDEARMFTALATGVMHFAMRKWAKNQHTSTPSDVLRAAIALVQRVTSPLQ